MGKDRRSGVRAPEFSGRGWLNSGGSSPRLSDFAGSPLLVVFWTASCAGSLASLEAVGRLRHRFGEQLAVVTVHSPKFQHQTRTGALAAAVERHGLELPVLDDAHLETWAAYGATAWPTFVLIDAEGHVAAHMAGPSHLALLPGLVASLLGEDGPPPEPEEPVTPPSGLRRALTGRGTPLRFPGKALLLPGDRPLAHRSWQGSVLVTDSAHGQLVVVAPDLGTELARIGTGRPGTADGAPGTARFVAPLGLTLLPAQVAHEVGYDVVVADPAAHALRGLRLADGSVRTLAAGLVAAPAGGTTGTIGPADGATLRGPGVRGHGLPTPSDVAWFDGFVAVAMAGLHQLWAFVPAADPAEERLAVLAGVGTEGMVDGPATKAWFAQPSGLAVDAGGSTLWIADAMSSSLRWLRPSMLGGGGYEVGTGVGAGLWTYGWRDGRRGDALLQHPMGLCALPDGSVAVADTYNGAIRRFDPAAGEMTTLAGDLDEPSCVVADRDTVVVVESGAHRLVRVDAKPSAGRRVVAPPPAGLRRPVVLSPGPVTVHVRFGPPEGEQLDDRFGAPTWLALEVEPPDLLVSGPGAGPGLDRELVVPELNGEGRVEGTLHVAVSATTRGVEEEGATAEYVQDWGIPVLLADGGSRDLVLDLSRP